MDSENAIDIMYETAGALCNFCGGQMPCYCEPPDNLDKWYEIDDEARNKVDFPHQD